MDVDGGVDVATSGGSGVPDAAGSVAFTDAELLVAQAFTSNGRTNTNQWSVGFFISRLTAHEFCFSVLFPRITNAPTAAARRQDQDDAMSK